MVRTWLRAIHQVAGVALVACFGCSRSRVDSLAPNAATQGSGQTAANGEAHASGKAERRESRLEYVELVTGGAHADEPLPMIVMLHGAGGRVTPEEFQGFSGRARWILAKGPHVSKGEHSWFVWQDFVKHGSYSKVISSRGDQVAELVVRVHASRPTVGKPIVAGFSQGAMLALAVTFGHEALVSEAVIVAGHVPDDLWPAAARSVSQGAVPVGAATPARVHPPVLAIHGELDTVMSLETTRSMIEALRRAHYPARLQLVPRVGHGLPAPVTAALHEALRAAIGRRVDDAGAPNAGAPNAGAPNAGAPKAGAPNAGAPTSIAPLVAEPPKPPKDEAGTRSPR